MLLTRLPKLEFIQMLRGIASILVVLLHVSVNYTTFCGRDFLGGMFLFGGSGVDIFFVLSGFIITYSSWQYIGHASTISLFLKKRFIRVYPVYWIIISFFFITQILLPGFYKTHFVFNTGNILSTYLLLPGHFMVNGVSWSLTNELFFYLMFTIVLFIPGKKYSLYLFIISFVAIVIVSIIGSDNVIITNWTALFNNSMNIEFLLGILIVLLLDKIPNSVIFSFLMGGIIMFTISGFIIDKGINILDDVRYPALSRVILFGIPSFFIIISLVKLEMIKKIKVHNVFLNLGDASYSIYLVHLPVVAAFYKILARLNITNVVTVFILSIVLLICICRAGIFIYKKIEKPLIKKLNNI